ncbi:putative NADH-dependent flavin oxidoreductase [Powellomyces hirtus]|nr:putative NADH-dependent flavin oxidoreductase [Powellomyces hirtus]
MTVNDILFTPVKVGDMQLKHRIALAPLTRSRSPKEVANTINAEYYAQRATDGGLLISEGTTCAATAIGYPDVPAILTAEQAAGWKLSTDAVHAKGGYIYAQLWHVGRASKPEFQPGGKKPVSASDIALEGKEAPRALSVEEIEEIVGEYKLSAQRSREAGFDGVEIHAAHGYLIDQFLQASSNVRTDAYGAGSIENRARFLFKVLDAVLSELPASKVAIRLSPYLDIQGAHSPDAKELFTYVLTRLATYNLSYVHLTEPTWGAWQTGPLHSESRLNDFKGLLKEPTKLILTGGYTHESATIAIKEGRADVIGIGRAFITNPDYVDRIRNGLELTPYGDPKGFYGGGRENYTSYKTYAEIQEEKKKTEIKEQPGAGAVPATHL